MLNLKQYKSYTYVYFMKIIKDLYSKTIYLIFRTMPKDSLLF